MRIETSFGYFLMISNKVGILGNAIDGNAIDLSDPESRANLFKIGIVAAERKYFSEANRVWAYLFAWSEGTKKSKKDSLLHYLWKSNDPSGPFENFGFSIAILHDKESKLELILPARMLSDDAMRKFCFKCTHTKLGKIKTGDPDPIGAWTTPILDALNVVPPDWVLSGKV